MDDENIARLCREYTTELKLELAEPDQPYAFDGTIRSLIETYTTDPTSPFQSIKHSTRIRDYQPTLRIIEETVGERRIDALRRSDFVHWHDQWGRGKRHRRAQGCIKLLRAILSYGATERLHGCSEAREILSIMKFKAPPSRMVKLERHHAYDIVENALEMGFPSIALTQALQWDTAIRRIDLIGQWNPCEPGSSGIVSGGTRWTGLTAQNVHKGILTIYTSKSGETQLTEHDLNECPLVQRVIQEYPLPKVGPLIVSEDTGKPWRENYYATQWRKIANEADVPEKIWSMDSRSGALSEAAKVVHKEIVQDLAGHTTPKMTDKYLRNSPLEANRLAARARRKLHDE
ncbi:MAG: hypothetical protein HRU27_19405 [Rhizobiaceae bacterium]|nr:hypothetical protein [Rhizobiaceae bacterium]